MSVVGDAPKGVVAVLDARLRDRVRRAGLDPQAQAESVRAIAEQVVGEHDRLSLTGQVTTLADPAAVVTELVARVADSDRCRPTSRIQRSKRCG